MRTGSTDIRDQLVAHYRPLALSIAKRTSSRPRDQDDIRQVAMIGLLHSVERFDPDRGIQFATFAWTTIGGEIKRYFRNTTSAVHVPRSLQERSQAATASVEYLTHKLGRAPTIAEIAGDVRLADDEVIEALDVSRSYSPSSIDSDPGDDNAPGYIRTLSFVDQGFDSSDDRQILRAMLLRLPANEQEVVTLRFFGELSQSEIGLKLGFSQMHVSRLLARALARMRSYSEHADN